MAKKQTKASLSDVFSKLKEELQIDTAVSSIVDTPPFIPDIIDFCYSKKYLDQKDQGLELYPVQKIILTAFYRGQIGNEKLKLTDKEISFLQEHNMSQILEKYDTKNLFRELVLVLGRRCVSEDTLIFDAKTGEQKTIKEWHNQNQKLSVWSYNEKTEQFEINEAETIYQDERPCFRVTINNGDYIDCTENHPLLTPNGWKDVSELKVGDKISQVDKFPPENTLKFKKIKSIEPIGNKNVYDLSVKNSHNFIIHNGLHAKNSGKDYLTSLIALYEALKLLEIPGGDPCKYYKIAPTPIYILTIATSADQAKVLFSEIRSKIQASPYFRNRIGSIETERIFLLTPADKKMNQELVDAGNPDAQTKGTVVIMAGHSNSDALLGKSVYALLLDEVASYKGQGKENSGERIYSALGPATMTFKNPVKKDSKGRPLLDSKIISISSPRAEEGILWKLYKDAQNVDSRLCFRLPTWEVNPNLDQEMLREENKYMSQTEFLMEFGAEFSGVSGEHFIPEIYIDEAATLGHELNLYNRATGDRNLQYYAHLDPATSSHNYALVVLHVEDRIRNKTKENGTIIKEKFKLFVVDHLKVWSPDMNRSICIEDVDNYIIDLSKRFKLVSVTYDSFNSASSIQKLRKNGISSKLTNFNKRYKIQIYDTLESLLINHQLALPNKGPHCDLLKMELKCLKRIYVNNGYRIKPDPLGLVTTDDLTDALCGAIGSASDRTYSGMVRGGTVYLPQSRDFPGNNWNIGSSTYSQSDIGLLGRFGKF